MNDKKPNLLYSPEIFKQRLLIIMQREGIPTWQKFENEIGMPGATYRWKSGKDQPTPESLLKISKRFGVSTDWLLKADEFIRQLQEKPSELYERRPQIPVDSGLLAEVITKIENTLRILIKEKKLHKLIEDQKIRLVAKVYAECADGNIKPGRNLIEKYLLLKD